MNHIINLFTVAILLVNLAAIGLFAQQFIRSYALAKAFAVVGGCLSLFFFEHFIGLGSIAWIWPISTIAAIYFIYTRGKTGWLFLLKSEIPFLVIFGIVFAWRYCFPDIDNRAEALADLAQSNSFLSGVRLPPPDYWLSQYPLDSYYTFQPYSTALIGRILGVEGGVAFTLAVCVILALYGSLIFSITRRFCGVKTTWFVTIAGTFGGTAASALAHFIKNWPDGDILGKLWSGIRFIGRYDKEIDTPFGLWLFPPSSAATQDMPLETPGFLMMLGDNHAPLGGFLILAITIAAMVSIEKDKYSKILAAGVGVSVALSLITNTWIFPLQALLVLGWWVVNWQNKQLLVNSFLGSVLGFALITPFLLYFAPNAVDSPLKWVAWADHTPIRKFVALFWPILFLIGVALTQFKSKSLTFMIAMVSVVVLIISEFFYVDDRGGGEYMRFNTTLKWWSWLQALVIVGLAPRVLSLGATWIRSVGLVIMFVFTTFTIDLTMHWMLAPKPSFGKLKGHHWITKEEQILALFNHLEDAPKGITLEYQPQAAYSRAGAISAFTDKPTFIGWPGHEALWRSNAWFINNRSMETKQFFEGQMLNSSEWLLQNDIKYVIWDPITNPKLTPEMFNIINGRLLGTYQWQWFDAASQVGVWVRR
jgi:uncharacterized membrane protein